MGNNKIKKLLAPKRLFAGNADHRHSYKLQVLVEINNLDNAGNIHYTRYHAGQKCLHCKALLVGEFINNLEARQLDLPIIRLKTNHTHRLDIIDVEYM